ncbi:SlyX family protein [Agaribacterium haliotis]|uniref:SlyX family protein n=1 Tax=Agaribacterium haliotis TaxID=2013869 RepID=UPI000BB53524|nr:SlyX family protein [Agaribacterium haliotis]
MSDLSEQVAELQSRLAHQEDWLQALNKRLVEQDNEIARLQLQVQHLHKQLKDSQQGALADAGANERPPHY